MPIFKRPTPAPAPTDARTQLLERRGAFIRQTYPPAPVRQARKGPAYVSAAEMMSLPGMWAAARTVCGIVSGLPVMHADTKEPVSMRSGLFARPAADFTWRELCYGLMMNFIVYGNGFWRISGVDGIGRVNQFFPIGPDQVHIARYPDGEGDGALVYWSNGQSLGRYDLLHFRLYVEGGYDVAMSPLITLARHLALMISEDELALNLFEDGGVPSGYWSTEGNVDETYIRRLADQINESAMGGRGLGTLVVDRGLEYKVPAMSFEELELLKCRQWSASEAAQIVGVPAHLINAPTYDSESYSNVSQDLELFSKVTLDVYRDCIVDTLRWHGIEIIMAEAELLKAPDLDRAQAAQIRVDTGLSTINEERARENLPPLPGGDKATPKVDTAPAPAAAAATAGGDPASNGSAPKAKEKARV